jgi:hypothetical protein
MMAKSLFKVGTRDFRANDNLMTWCLCCKAAEHTAKPEEEQPAQNEQVNLTINCPGIAGLMTHNQFRLRFVWNGEGCMFSLSLTSAGRWGDSYYQITSCRIYEKPMTKTIDWLVEALKKGCTVYSLCFDRG